MSDMLLQSTDKGVHTITLNRPEIRNAFNDTVAKPAASAATSTASGKTRWRRSTTARPATITALTAATVAFGSCSAAKYNAMPAP